MFLSVVIPAYNEEKCIVGCVRSVFAACEALAARENLADDFSFEVIVVDNNSTDQTATLAKSEGASVVFEPRNQISRARNRGAAAAQGEWLLFLDADSTLSEGLLTDTVAAMRSGRVAGGGTLVRFPKNAARIVRVTARLWGFLSRTFRWAAGSYLFCRADIFREAGGFDESLYISEEIDLSARLKRAGRRQGLEFVILTRFPVETSDRKVHLYGPAAHLKFLCRLLLAPRKTRRDAKRCDLWYSGKR
jgi:glycosyltransferase involved in cell wall biosynthesis